MPKELGCRVVLIKEDRYSTCIISSFQTVGFSVYDGEQISRCSISSHCKSKQYFEFSTAN